MNSAEAGAFFAILMMLAGIGCCLFVVCDKLDRVIKLMEARNNKRS